jgi:fumarate hydratase class II
MPDTSTRVERDTMGEMEVASEAYFGASTQRAVINFPVSGIRLPRRFIRAIGLIKGASAQVNRDLGLLDAGLSDPIARAAREVADGLLDAHFPIDVFQTGSGTSTNMNANEVIASRANEIATGKRGGKDPVHPNDHVNQQQPAILSHRSTAIIKDGSGAMIVPIMDHATQKISVCSSGNRSEEISGDI